MSLQQRVTDFRYLPGVPGAANRNLESELGQGDWGRLDSRRSVANRSLVCHKYTRRGMPDHSLGGKSSQVLHQEIMVYSMKVSTREQPKSSSRQSAPFGKKAERRIRLTVSLADDHVILARPARAF